MLGVKILRHFPFRVILGFLSIIKSNKNLHYKKSYYGFCVFVCLCNTLFCLVMRRSSWSTTIGKHAPSLPNKKLFQFCKGSLKNRGVWLRLSRTLELDSPEVEHRGVIDLVEGRAPWSQSPRMVKLDRVRLRGGQDTMGLTTWWAGHSGVWLSGGQDTRSQTSWWVGQGGVWLHGGQDTRSQCRA